MDFQSLYQRYYDAKSTTTLGTLTEQRFAQLIDAYQEHLYLNGELDSQEGGGINGVTYTQDEMSYLFDTIEPYL